MIRSSCVVSNCRTHTTIDGVPDFLKTPRGHFNCTPAHPCLGCVACPDCKTGKAYHSSIHGAYVKPGRKDRVILTQSQKDEVRSLAHNGADAESLALQFKADISTVRNILRKQ